MLVRDTRKGYELIEGVKFMAPSPGWGHVNVTANLIKIIGTYASVKKLGVVAADNFDVHFPDGNLFQPDFIFVSAEKAELFLGNKNMTLHGVPDMVVEVLSHSTRKKDLTIKKDIYEAQGVKEYWIVDPRAKSVMVYLLRDGKYLLDEVYTLMSEDDLKLLDEDELADVKYEVPVSILDGLNVPLEFIFSWGY